MADHNRDGLRHAERAGDLLSVIRIRSNRASHLVEEGDYHAALAELDLVLPLAELTGFTTYRALCLSNRGEARLCLGQLDEATADLVAAEAAFTAAGSTLAAVPLTHLAEVYRRRGDRVQARTAYQRAIRLAEANNTVTQLVPALAGLARLLAQDEPDTAAALVRRALSFGAGVGQIAALLASADLERSRGDGVAELLAASQAELLARKRGDRATLADALELQARAHKLLASGGMARDQGAGPPLVIQALGGFRVLHDGRPVPANAWQSRRARDLVKILVARRGRPVSREMLISLLWPGEPADRAGNRLSVALSTARTVLGAQRGATGSCLVSENDIVRIDTGMASMDVVSFLADARCGLDAWQRGEPDAVPLLESAESTYTGDFLEEDPYEDWAPELREEARLTYIQVATVLSGHSAAIGEHVPASRYCLRILERDRYNEPAHLALVRALAAAGSHGEARRRYRTYVARMAEIDVEPGPFPGG